MDQKKKKREYIVGLIYEKNERSKDKLVAVKMFDLSTMSCRIESLNLLLSRIKKDEAEIYGVRVKTEVRYRSNIENFKVKEYCVLTKSPYDCRKLPILNGNGEIILDGKDVVIGLDENNQSNKYMVVNSNGEIRLLSKEEVIENDYVGVNRKGITKHSNEYICLE